MVEAEKNLSEFSTKPHSQQVDKYGELRRQRMKGHE